MAVGVFPCIDTHPVLCYSVGNFRDVTEEGLSAIVRAQRADGRCESVVAIVEVTPLET